MIKLFSKSRKPDPQYTLLLKDLYKTRSELANAYSNLEYMTDPDLIDYYIYQVKAAQMRHKFLLTKVKQFETQILSWPPSPTTTPSPGKPRRALSSRYSAPQGFGSCSRSPTWI